MVETVATTTKWCDSPIAICLSGGGYRAAAFHLGTLAYLHHLDLLKNLASISTVSGGTFTGVSYTLSLVESESFAHFYHRFHKLLAETDLVTLALGRLGRTADHGRGDRNVIVAMADVYADTFFKNSAGKPYLLQDIMDARTHLPDVSFNATEFRTGIAFRFQNRRGAAIGNGHISIPREEAGGIRLADVVAASSCFPGGFEPLAFPDDFVWPNGSIPEPVIERLARNDLPPRIALMDGGVYDNQGASTLREAVKHIADELSMFIISDVDIDSKNIYNYPQNLGIRGFIGQRTLGQVKIAAAALSLACLVSCATTAVLFSLQVWNEGFSGFKFALYLLQFLVALFTFAAVNAVWNVILQQVLPTIPQVGRAAWNDLKRITVSQAASMVALRISSLYAMSSNVFMRRIRQLIYASIFRDRRFKKKQVANLIYALKDAPAPAANHPTPSEPLRQLAIDASDMPTTLWFHDQDQLQTLTTCGQATLCHKLIKLIHEQFGDAVDAYPADVKTVYGQLSKDWAAFCSKPGVIEPESPRTTSV